MILKMIPHFSFVDEEEILTAKEQQHVEAMSHRKFFKEKLKKKVNVLSAHSVNHTENPN
jgi:hypothetical protein